MRRDARYLIVSGVQCVAVVVAIVYALSVRPSRMVDSRLAEFESRLDSVCASCSNLVLSASSSTEMYTVDFSSEDAPEPVEPKVIGSGYLRGSRNLWVYTDLEYPDGTQKRIYKRAGPSDLELKRILRKRADLASAQ